MDAMNFVRANRQQNAAAYGQWGLAEMNAYPYEWRVRGGDLHDENHLRWANAACR